jgi:coenzyme F420-0:L-glutamate ligase/coenzyme F420-1:gamma-L-glutamate ligase
MVSASEIRVIGVPGLPEFRPGDDVAGFVIAAVRDQGLETRDGDLFVVAQKIVSKTEGRIVALDSIDPSPLANEWGAAHGKDPRVVEVVLRESKRIVRMSRGVLICETRHGFVCANAGVDASNAPEGAVVLLPVDPDGSARRIRAALERAFGVRLAVIIADTFGRPWREGLVNVALGVSGVEPLIDHRGRPDTHGRLMIATVIAMADEAASAAELVMGKCKDVPVAIIRGLCYEVAAGSGRELIRSPENDLFR